MQSGNGKQSLKLSTAHCPGMRLDHDVQIGVDFALKVLNWDADTLIRLQLWDIAGDASLSLSLSLSLFSTVFAPVLFHTRTEQLFQKQKCGPFFRDMVWQNKTKKARVFQISSSMLLCLAFSLSYLGDFTS